MTETKCAILLIEDDDIDREIVHRLLKPDYTVYDAATGVEARQVVDSQALDCVLLDYRLPDIDGLALLAAFVDKNLPVVVLTGEERPEIIVQAMQAGAQDYLVKGQISRAALDRAIGNAIEKVTMRLDLEDKQRKLAQQATDLAQKNQQVRELASALTLAEQRERRHISQILHDYVQQMLYGIQMRTHLVGLDVTAATQPEIHEHLIEINKLLQQAIQATRTLTVELSPPVLKGDGMGTVFEWLASHMQETYGLQVAIEIQGDGQAPNEDLHVLLFQLVRELLFNVVKHAGVTQVQLLLWEADGEFCITVEDSGVGFNVQAISGRERSGFGLYSIRERLALFGGRVEIVSQPGDGASITIAVPMQDERRTTNDEQP